MYLDDDAAQIQRQIPKEKMPNGNAEELFRMYAVLLRAKGAKVTNSDVHDAWSAWMTTRDSGHVSLVPYERLPEDVRNEDEVFLAAIRQVASEAGDVKNKSSLEGILFPLGPPKSDSAMQQTLDLYKIMVASSEGLVNRRQTVNTFFLTINGALLTASGLIVQNSGGNKLSGLGVAVLAATGAILCLAWRSLILSFGQLNYGKFQVIDTIERFLYAAVYAAEWEALGRGENPKIYRSFTSREIWVPTSLLFLYLLAVIVGVAVAIWGLSFSQAVGREPVAKFFLIR